MNYKDLKVTVKKQISGHYVSLFLILFVSNITLLLVNNSISQFMDITSTFYVVFSFLFTFINIIISNTVVFFFIKRVRDEIFTMRDVSYSLRKVGFHIVSGLFLSFIQMLVQFICAFLGALGPIYLVVLAIVQIFFVLWNACIVFAIYDGNTKLFEMIRGGFGILSKEIKPILITCIPFILWFAILQILISLAMRNFLPNPESVQNIIDLLIKASTSKDAGMALLTLGGGYLLYYVGQYAFLISIYITLANVYEHYKKDYMPSNQQRIA